MTSTRDRRFDVAILGAGASGLAAAARLCAKGLRLAIIEARDRVGGRIHTFHDAKFPRPIELGAEFIHSREGEVWPLLQAAGGTAYFADGDHFHLRGGKLRKDNEFWDEVGAVLSKLQSLKKDTSFAEFIRSRFRRPTSATRAALSFVEGFHAAPADRISALSIREAETDESDPSGASDSFRIVGGYDAILRMLMAGLKNHEIFLRTVVKTIRWRRGEVVLETKSDKTIRARRAIITLPVGVLRAESVRFEPDLPQKRDAWRQIDMGQVVKVIVRFREPFWETRQLPNAARGERLKQMSFMHGDGAPFPVWWSHWPVRGDVLTAWAGGPSASALSLRPKREILDAAITSLATITGITRGRLQRMVTAAHVADWQADPFARGAYSYHLVGSMPAAKVLAKPVERTLFFAGEATASEGLGGTVDAALVTGYRAADEVLRSRL